MTELIRLVKDSLTDDSNVTWDMFRVLAVASIAVGFALEAWSIGHGKTFSMQEFGIGVGALLGGVGVALRLDKTTPVSESHTTTYKQESTITKDELK
jgi:hypothetical protein